LPVKSKRIPICNISLCYSFQQITYCQNSQTMCSCEVSVSRSNILKSSSLRVIDLNIGSQVFIAVVCTEIPESFICDTRDIELMVPDCEKIIVDVLKDRVRG
jgi:hypothetical protein